MPQKVQKAGDIENQMEFLSLITSASSGKK